MALILPTTIRGFHDYFKLTAIPEELVVAFGYHFEAETLTLPLAPEPLPWLAELSVRLDFAFRHVGMSSETPRREFLIAPVLGEVARHVDAQVRSELDVRVSGQLKGALDYLLQAQGNLLVIEAKQADLTRGFSQLCAELIAVDQWTDSTVNTLYGAVSVGDIWRFGMLERTEKRITQDLGLFSIPTNTECLVRTLISILRGEA
ncbi:hypothetical protein [Armatimonas sp.]|uniref:hypothetical protein n=1 Tax=Armatimonas sp. TaxID=1872638 RepID=UPI00286A7B11|nr:hypothetical protein [Armatimonas sp.]